jgi:NADH-ubiquinone oxidoreductase chain 5
MNHAFLKALLFLSAGSIIHAMHDEQDMRRMGASNRIPPFTYTMTLIGSFASIGFPSLTGYHPKDSISEVACSKSHFPGNLAYRSGAVSASFTTFYSYRLVFLTFLNKSNPSKQYILHAHDASATAAIPLTLLAVGSMFIGYLTKDTITGIGSSFRGQSLFILSENVSYAEAEYLPYHIKLIPFILSHSGILFAYHTSFFLSSDAVTARQTA